jgi:hypothetical protein
VIGGLAADFPLPCCSFSTWARPSWTASRNGSTVWVPLSVDLARDGQVIQAGHVYVAPGDRHLELGPNGTLRVSDAAPVGGQRPAATVLFRSVARQAGAQGIGVLLTGMGEDGAQGLLDMRKAGAATVAEHESSAVVYGMPAAAVRLNAAARVLPSIKWRPIWCGSRRGSRHDCARSALSGSTRHPRRATGCCWWRIRRRRRSNCACSSRHRASPCSAAPPPKPLSTCSTPIFPISSSPTTTCPA